MNNINSATISLCPQDKVLALFDKLNEKYFDNCLNRPSIYISPSIRDYSRFNPIASVVYNRSNINKYEINISTSLLSLPIENFCAILLHEMCHMYNYMNGIKDTSRQDTYHNKKFKKSAEEHGLNVVRSEKYGYSITLPSVELVEWCYKDLKEKAIGLFRYVDKCADGTKLISNKYVSKKHNYRYECPGCHSIVRSGRPVFIICGECGYTME